MTAPLPVADDRTRGAAAPRNPERFVAWVDGVGAFLLCLGETTTLGGLSGRADVRLAADLASKHVAIERSGEGYVVQANGPALVAKDRRASGAAAPSYGSGRVVEDRTDLSDGDELVLYRESSKAVRLRFRRPNALTATATLSIASDHRTEPRYDGIVLLAEACVLGSRSDAHVRCREWPETVLLFRRDGELWCKSAAVLSVSGREVSGPVAVGGGEYVAAPGISFRLEAL